jgi:hypothetical protein
MNRGIARRTAFEGEADIRSFLGFVAGAVHARRIELVAYTILSTHFHLLVRSLDGEISKTLCRIENPYVRRFNRTRRRDGPLFRGRFRSFPVESTSYLHTLIRYIDQNPVEARLTRRPEDYPYGSARHHLRADEHPRWLSRQVVDDFIGPWTGLGLTRQQAYRRLFSPRLSEALRRFVEARLDHPARAADDLDDLVGGSPEEVQQWMCRKARLADGTKPGMPMADGRSVRQVIDSHLKQAGRIEVATGRRRPRRVRALLEVALLHDLAGETFRTIGRRLLLHETQVHRTYGEHQIAMTANRAYSALVGDFTRIALRVHTDGMALPSARIQGPPPPRG